MEDILASIRRILSEEEQGGPAPREPPPREPGSDDVLMLDPSMMLPELGQAEHQPRRDPPASATPPADQPPKQSQPTKPSANPSAEQAPDHSLVAPEAATAAASAMADLIRKLASDRALQVHGGGPTIVDLVRAELRPLLKEWLDANLPLLVERLMRAEIERVVGRAFP